MEGNSTTNRLMSDLEALPAYNANKARGGGSKEKDANDGLAQPPVIEPDPVDPIDPSPLVVPASAEPNCAVRADTDSLNEHEQAHSELLSWAYHLPGILFKINSGHEYFLMPDCAPDARKISTRDSNIERDV
ncbi:hypothetical protein B0H11DRAFT_2255743 [Mycena galericulata]|nr:hypothetical protein B0H11DRAFT_2255743 [Mycena galericulata]